MFKRKEEIIYLKIWNNALVYNQINLPSRDFLIWFILDEIFHEIVYNDWPHNHQESNKMLIDNRVADKHEYNLIECIIKYD